MTVLMFLLAYLVIAWAFLLFVKGFTEDTVRTMRRDFDWLVEQSKARQLWALVPVIMRQWPPLLVMLAAMPAQTMIAMRVSSTTRTIMFVLNLVIGFGIMAVYLRRMMRQFQAIRGSAL